MSTFDELLKREQERPHRKRSAYLEDRLQMSCKYWFDCQYPELRLLMFHPCNEGKLLGRDKDGAKRKAMGVRAGVADFIFLCPNKEYPYLAIELKTEDGRQSDHQRAFQADVEKAGGRYVIVRSIEEFTETVNEYINNK